MTTHVRPPISCDEIICNSVQSTNWTLMETGISVIAIIAGALIVKWQVKENAKKQIWKEVYKELSDANRRLGETESDLTSYVRSASMNLGFLHEGVIDSFNQMRALTLNELHGKLQDARHNLVMLLEAYEIVEPRIKIFHTALNVVFHDIRSIQNEMFTAHLRTMPIERNGSIFLQGPFAQETVNDFQNLSDNYIEQLSMLGCVCYDFNVEMQNVLLGSIFDHRVERRMPKDPKYFVIRFDRSEKLMTFFENDTAWGKEKKKWE